MFFINTLFVAVIKMFFPKLRIRLEKYVRIIHVDSESLAERKFAA